MSIVESFGETVSYLDWAYEHAGRGNYGGYVAISSIDQASRWSSSFHPVHELNEAAAAAVEQSRKGKNAYYRLHLLAGPLSSARRGGARETHVVTHIAADVDVSGPGHKPPPGAVLPSREQALSLIDHTLPPSAIVSSGGGYYPVLRLAESIEITSDAVADRIRDLGRRYDNALRGHGFHVDRTANNLAGLIRPPGLVNRKPGREPRPISIERSWNAGAGDYSLVDLEALLPPLQRRQCTRTKNNVPIGAARWSRFSARYTVDDVLAHDPNHEWEAVGLVDGMCAWRYIGSSSP